MHLLVDDQQRAHERACTWWRRRWQGRIVTLVSRLANYQGPGDTPSVTAALMRSGGVRVVLSVLYQPFDEMDLTQEYGAPPREGYFSDIIAQRQTVEDHVAAHPDELAIAHSARELDELLGGETPVLIHAIEGGFQVGATAPEVRANVGTLAQLGIAYVTVAHLFYRHVATSAPALPFLPDRLYHLVFPQRRGEGLTALGRALVDAMVDEGILIDVTHMSAAATTEVLDLLDDRDPEGDVPVIATHMACRFGGLEYCLDDATIGRIARRGGLLGLILCQHYVTSGLARIPATFDGSVAALCRHIDHIHELTGGHEHTAFGSDLDIKPALPGLQDMSRMAQLRRALGDRYGEAVAEQICGGNALRVLGAHWGRKRPRAAVSQPA